MMQIVATCATCEGHKVVSVRNPLFSLSTCPTCCGSGKVLAELEAGLLVTRHTGPDCYPHIICHVFSPRHIGIVSGTSLDGAKVVTELTLRNDGKWREKGQTKKSSCVRFEFGMARDYRSREV